MSTFLNPRLAALPCERMRGCMFADNFISLTTMDENKATLVGTGNTCNRGFTTDGNGYAYFRPLIMNYADTFSFVIRFSTETLYTESLLYYSHDLTSGVGGYLYAFCIWLDEDGVKANHCDSLAIGDVCSVDLDYSDGEIHTITYVINNNTDKHYLYVDSIAADEQDTNLTHWAISNSSINVYVSNGLIGTVYKARIFHECLTEEEHDLYHADTLTDFWKSPIAAYRCDSRCDDTVGHYICDRTTSMNDLSKGDQISAATMPTFGSGKYLWDDDGKYIGSIPELGSQYTVSAVSSLPQSKWPETQQHNDTTLTAQLISTGAYWGFIHNMTLHGKVLAQLELNHAKYMQLYNESRGRASLAPARLIHEDVCKLGVFMDAGINVYQDYSNYMHHGQAFDVTRNGADGVSFGSADSRIEFLASDTNVFSKMRGTYVVYGDFDSPASGTWIDNDTDFPLEYVAGGTNYIYLDNNSIEYDLSNNTQIAVTFADSRKPRFYVDGKYIGDGTLGASPNPSVGKIIVGNNYTANNVSQHDLKQAFYFSETLTDDEIWALYESSLIIGAQDMDVGNRITVPYVTSAAVNIDCDPGGPFRLIDVAAEWDSTPTVNPETFTIKTIRTVSSTPYTVNEDSFEPVLTLDSDDRVIRRFDKSFPDNCVIAIDFANSETKSVTVLVTYQMEDAYVV